MMRVSQNEVYRMTQRALEAAGAGHGIDRDGAFAVAWLAARGLPGAAMLAAALDRMDGAFVPLAPPCRNGSTQTLDLGGRSAVAWAGTLVDAADLLLDRGAREVRLARCRWPLFLLPLAARRAAGHRSIRVFWAVGDNVVTCVAERDGACRIIGEGPETDLAAVFLDPAPVEIVIERPASAVRAQDRSRGARVIDADTLAATLQRTLTEGIALDPAHWARIAKAASRVLVPASAESRSRGAGGGDANA